MNQEVKEMWVRDLEATTEIQGKGRLRGTRNGVDEWCCLGRLCELHRLATGAGEWTEMEEKGEPDSEKGLTRWRYGPLGAPIQMRDVAHLPLIVRAWAGLQTADPLLRTEPDNNSSAAGLNDHGSTFHEIAQYLKAYEGEPAKEI